MNHTDLDLTIKIKKSNCEKSLIELIQRHSNLCHSICQKYAPAMFALGIHPEDISGDKDYIIYKSAISYKPSKKIKFSTWLGNQVRYYCLNKINKNNTLITMPDEDLNYFVNQKNAPTEEDPYKEVREFVFQSLSNFKDKRILDVYKERYYGKDGRLMTWKNISKKMEISPQTAINLHNRGRAVLHKKIKKFF